MEEVRRSREGAGADIHGQRIDGLLRWREHLDCPAWEGLGWRPRPLPLPLMGAPLHTARRFCCAKRPPGPSPSSWRLGHAASAEASNLDVSPKTRQDSSVSAVPPPREHRRVFLSRSPLHFYRLAQRSVVSARPGWTAACLQDPGRRNPSPPSINSAILSRGHISSTPSPGHHRSLKPSTATSRSDTPHDARYMTAAGCS